LADCFAFAMTRRISAWGSRIFFPRAGQRGVTTLRKEGICFSPRFIFRTATLSCCMASATSKAPLSCMSSARVALFKSSILNTSAGMRAANRSSFSLIRKNDPYAQFRTHVPSRHCNRLLGSIRFEKPKFGQFHTYRPLNCSRRVYRLPVNRTE